MNHWTFLQNKTEKEKKQVEISGKMNCSDFEGGMNYTRIIKFV